ncbi:MAG: hypothetical protein ACTSU5_02755 [Promethearchaeota archaeon]
MAMNNQMKNYRKSPFPFKSPHKRGIWRNIYNTVCVETKRKKEMCPLWGGEKKALRFSDQVVARLEGFSRLGSYDSLEVLEETLPLHYAFLLPARQGLVVYAAYSRLLSAESGRPVNYDDLLEYLGMAKAKKRKLAAYRNFFPNLVRWKFRLYQHAKPFRLLLGKKVRKDKDDKRGRKIRERAEQVVAAIGKMKEWEEVDSPSAIVASVGEVLRRKGFAAALQRVRHVIRAAEKVRNVLSGARRTPFNPEKVRDVTTRYLGEGGAPRGGLRGGAPTGGQQAPAPAVGLAVGDLAAKVEKHRKKLEEAKVELGLLRRIDPSTLSGEAKELYEEKWHKYEKKIRKEESKIREYEGRLQ